MKARPVDPAFAAKVLAELRRRVHPVTGRALARWFGVDRLRTIQEAIHYLRCRGWRIGAGRAGGYYLARRRREIAGFLAQRRRANREEWRALEAMDRGRAPQTSIPATRTRRAA